MPNVVFINSTLKFEIPVYFNDILYNCNLIPTCAVINTPVPDWVEPEHGREVDELTDDASGHAQPRVVPREFIGQFQDGEDDVKQEEHAYLVEGLTFL